MRKDPSSATTESSDISDNADLRVVETGEGGEETATKSKKFHVARRDKLVSSIRDGLCRKSCAVYLLTVVFIWILHTIPIITFFSVNATYESVNQTNVDQVLVSGCSEGFFLDNSSGITSCRPECGEWDQYPDSTRRAVYGVNITFILVTLALCAITFVWSIFRRKIMFRYPNILLIYITCTRVLLSVLHLVGYTDEKALYCTSRDRVAGFAEGSPFCNIIGSATTFIPTFDLMALCFHLGTVLFTAYFPFKARKLETKGGYKYLHIVAIIGGVGFGFFLVGIQFGVGGYSRTVVPIFCLAASESAFIFGIIPACFISALFLTFVMALLFKIIDLEGWKLKQSKKPANSTTTEKARSTANQHTWAQIKLVLIFCAQGFATIINYSAYSVVLKSELAYSQSLEDYFSCEEPFNNSSRPSCDRSFEAYDPTPITFPLTTIAYILLPLSTLIYVANTNKLLSKCKARLVRNSTRSTGSN